MCLLDIIGAHAWLSSRRDAEPMSSMYQHVRNQVVYVMHYNTTWHAHKKKERQ